MKTNRRPLTVIVVVLNILLMACNPLGLGSTPMSHPTEQPSVSVQTPMPSATEGTSLNVAVKGSDAIYLAGRDDVVVPPLETQDTTFPLLRCGGETFTETFPVALSITPSATFVFNASGAVDYYGGDQPATGPDASPDVVSDIQSLGGISGYTGPAGALVGVFLDDNNPKNRAAPTPLDFSKAA